MKILIAALSISTCLFSVSAFALDSKVTLSTGEVYERVFENKTVEVFETKSVASPDTNQVRIGFENLIMEEGNCRGFTETTSSVGVRSECRWESHFTGGTITIEVTHQYFAGLPTSEKVTTVVVTRSTWVE